MLLTSVSLPVHSAHIPLALFSIHFFLYFAAQFHTTYSNTTTPVTLIYSYVFFFLFSVLCLLYFFCFFPFLSFNQYTFSFLFLSVWFMSHPFTTSGKLLPPEILVKTHHTSFITIMKLLFFCKGIHSVVAYLILGFGFKCNI